MKHLMHIELMTEVSRPIDRFIPRIPKKTAPYEDRSVLRICTSTSIEKCSHAHPSIGFNLIVIPNDGSGSDRWMDVCQYFLELGEHGMLLRVYHFEVEDSMVMDSAELLKIEAVPDVLATDEHWITEEIVPKRISYAVIQEGNRIGNDSDILVVKETDTLDELGIFMPLPLVDDYLHCDRENHQEKLRQVNSKEDALSLKSEITALLGKACATPQTFKTMVVEQPKTVFKESFSLDGEQPF